MLRGRDLVAAFVAVLLTRMAWTENYMSESLSVSLRLAFYTSWTSSSSKSLSQTYATAPPVPMDVDGDGTVEAIAMIHRSNSTTPPSVSWTVQVLDLKPLHQSNAPSGSGPQSPFRPQVIFSSPPIQNIYESNDDTPLYPLKMASGQIVVHHPQQHHNMHTHDPLAKDNQNHDKDEKKDRSRHYFCGSDWHDAANNCNHHCPTGLSTECPDGTTCFADTPCDSQHKAHTLAEDGSFEFPLVLTPGGGLPSIATLWSDGSVSMHSLTADHKYRSKRQRNSDLELRLLWRTTPILKSAQNKSDSGDKLELKDFDLILLGREDIDAAVVSSGTKENKDAGKFGMVVVGGSYTSSSLIDDYYEDEIVPFTHALDVMTGESLWEQVDSNTTTAIEAAADKSPVSEPPVRGMESRARRRSRIISLHAAHQQHTPEDNAAGTGSGAGISNCLVGYKHSLLDPNTGSLPHAYWGTSDMTLVATHLDKRKRSKPHKNPNNDKKLGTKWHSSLAGKDKPSSSKHHHQHHHHHKRKSLLFGRPNVLVSHHQGGLNVVSLRNGRIMCHLSLLDQVLYADLNYDGLLDHIQVVTDDNTGIFDPNTGELQNKWAADLVKRIDKTSPPPANSNKPLNNRICHILALSGMPAREELFSAQVCPSFGPNRKGSKERPSVTLLQAAPPLAVERMDGHTEKGSDIVVALNNGVVSRYEIPIGKKQWQVHNQETLPTWGPDEGDMPSHYSNTPFVGRIDFAKAIYAPWIRPIIITGEDGMALLSTGQGQLMATTKFPQTSIGRPILADLSGDGTTDVVIISTDAIWGYQVVVRTGGSIMLRIMVGLLMICIGMAILRNRFGQRRGADKRSTDV